MSAPYIPDIPAGCSVVDGAKLYAAAGWYVLPLDPSDKHAGSLVGKGWPEKSSRDPEQITRWWQTWPNAALALHVGRSGAVAIDVDKVEETPDALRLILQRCPTVFQKTRTNDHAERGHYLYAAEPGRFGNSPGDFGLGWGDVRGLNGIVVVAPTPHSKAAEGGRYAWQRTGTLTPVPDPLASRLRPPGAPRSRGVDDDVDKFLAELPGDSPCPAVARVLDRELPKIGRHQDMLARTQKLIRFGEQGHHGAREALEWLQDEFVAAVEGDRQGGVWQAANEYADAVGGAMAAVRETPTAETDRRCCGANRDTPTLTPLSATPSATVNGRRLRVVRASEVRPKIAHWLWEPDTGRIPAGELSVVAGRGNVGKSPFCLWLAARLTRGDLPGKWQGTPVDALVYASEDSIAHTIVPRLMATGADLARVHFIEGTETDDDPELPLDWRGDLPLIAEQIETTGAAVLVLDPLAVVHAGGTDANNPQQMRESLAPLVTLAHRTGASVLGISHFNKAKSTDIATLLSQSHSLRDVARAVLVCAEGADGERVLGQDKNNLGRAGDDVPRLTYVMESRDVAIEDEQGLTRMVSQPAFVITGETDASLRDVIGRTGGDDDGSVKPPPESIRWVLEALAEAHPEPVPAHELARTADRRGQKWDSVRKSMSRTKTMRCTDERKPGGSKPHWCWRLTKAGAEMVGQESAGADEGESTAEPPDGSVSHAHARAQGNTPSELSDLPLTSKNNVSDLVSDLVSELQVGHGEEDQETGQKSITDPDGHGAVSAGKSDTVRVGKSDTKSDTASAQVRGKSDKADKAPPRACAPARVAPPSDCEDCAGLQIMTSNPTALCPDHRATS